MTSDLAQPEFHLELQNGLMVDGETFESLAQARYAAIKAALTFNQPVIIRKSFDFFVSLLTEETVLPA
jgi:hypothetical protein